MKKKFTEADAKAWIAQLERAHSEAFAIVQCGLWALKSCSHLKSKAFGEGNVYSFREKRPLSPDLEPYPCVKMRSFQEIGRQIDEAFSLINSLLPEAEEERKA